MSHTPDVITRRIFLEVCGNPVREAYLDLDLVDGHEVPKVTAPRVPTDHRHPEDGDMGEPD